MSEYLPDVFPLRAKGSLFTQDEPSRREVKVGRRAEQLAHWVEVCKEVDRRDGRRCRACGRHCDVKALTLLDRAHRHHVTYRSAGGPDETWNVATLCASCHDHQHRGLLDVRGNADHGLEIWRPDERGQLFMSRREVAPGIIEKD